MALGTGSKALGAVSDLLNEKNELHKQNTILRTALEKIADISVDTKSDLINRPELLHVVLTARTALCDSAIISARI